MLQKNGRFIILLTFIVLFPFKSEAGTPQLIDISTKKTSMIFHITSDGEVLFQYYGSRINDQLPFFDKKSYRRSDLGTDPNVYPAQGGRNYIEPALSVTHDGGDINTELRYKKHYAIDHDNYTETRLILTDTKYPFEVELRYRAYRDEDVIVCNSIITNYEKGRVTLGNYYSSFLPLKAGNYYLTHFYGSWAREMTVEETRLNHGITTIETKKGVRTTHTENPSFMLSLDVPLNERSGRVIAGALAWSGNYKINFQIDEWNILGITAGINPFSAEWYLAPGESFATPEMVYTYSAEGAGQASRNLHDWARAYRIWSPKTPRPTLLNSWEGVYFDFDQKKLMRMIDDAAEMGLEMFVLDDGWFGNKYPRDNTKQGLGDWQVNRRKLPKGIGALADYAAGKGLQFGLWIEPEMVSPKSELAEKHPDWIVGANNGREQITMRNQWLLDLCNPEVQDFVFGIFDQVMQMSPNINYIKWDANRHVEGAFSPYLQADLQSHFWTEYTKGLYNVYERIRAKYPNVIIQACASGGGRVEYGALKYNNEVWTSDNSDAVSRARIQYGTSMIYPALVIGSHVSKVPSHQTNNVSPLKFRLDMAMSGRMGMELQPATLSSEEKELSKKTILIYKSIIRDIVLYGDLYRISSPYDDSGWYSLMYVTKDKKQAVIFAYNLKYQGRALTPRFLLNGLNPDEHYYLKELNVEESKFWGDGKMFSGEYLINEGINPHLSKVYDSGVYFLKAE